MGCLRCGKEVKDRNVFCDECKTSMEDYPIKPGTVVVIPHREPGQPEKRSKRKANNEEKAEKRTNKKANRRSTKKNGKKLSPTEQDNYQLRVITRLLLGTAAVLLGAVCFLVYLLFKEHF